MELSDDKFNIGLNVCILVYVNMLFSFVNFMRRMIYLNKFILGLNKVNFKLIVFDWWLI